MQGLSHAAAPEMNKFSIVAHCNTSVMSVVRCGTTGTRCVQTCSVGDSQVPCSGPCMYIGSKAWLTIKEKNLFL